MDPYMAKRTYRNTGLTVVETINNAIKSVDPNFPLFSVVNPAKEGKGQIAAGHKDILALLYYDKSKPIGKGNTPGMLFSNRCQNTTRCVMNYRFAKPSQREGAAPVTQKPEEEYKHGIDPIRYLLALKPSFWEPDHSGSVSEPPTAAAA